MIRDDLLLWTVSNLFYVPMFKIGRPKLAKHGFVNSYLFNGESEEQIENAIYLLFKPDNMELFNDFVEELREKKVPIIGENDYPDGFVLLTLQLPSKYQKDYDLIWEGAYSKTSEDFQKTIPSYVKYNKPNGVSVTDMTIQHMIFSRYEFLRRHWESSLNIVMEDTQELWSKPTVESETFKLENHVKSLATSS